ncbi:MAG TPA: LuxR C-terminal-related transcriptional regulator, partial [Roseiflexaceae bacterium]|nr:LuxR C-terminal-related transcriptional regulator [Roseiflexaceae bacterium]
EPALSPGCPYDECGRDLVESLRLARQIDWPAGQAYAECAASLVSEVYGEFGAALAHARAALQIAIDIEHRQWLAAAYLVLGRISVTMLAPEQAIRDLLPGLALARALGSNMFIGGITAPLAQAYICCHDLSQAEAVLGAALPPASLPRTLEDRHVILVSGELALAQATPKLALRIAEQLIETAPGAARGPIPVLLKLKGEALLALGRPHEAVQVLEEAQRDTKARGLRPLLWQILRALGQAQQRLGGRTEASHSFAAAREIVGVLAATIDEADLRDQFLRAARASFPQERAPTPQRAEAQRFSGLTERERAVAALIAQGHSNQEIATALVVSKRTVETHVGNIMGKLGATTRAQVVAWAIGHGLVPPS